MTEPITALTTLKLIAAPTATGLYDLPALQDTLRDLYDADRIADADAYAVYDMACSLNVAQGALDEGNAIREKAKRDYATRPRIAGWLRDDQKVTIIGVAYMGMLMVAALAGLLAR